VSHTHEVAVAGAAGAGAGAAVAASDDDAGDAAFFEEGHEGSGRRLVFHFLPIYPMQHHLLL